MPLPIAWQSPYKVEILKSPNRTFRSNYLQIGIERHADNPYFCFVKTNGL